MRHSGVQFSDGYCSTVKNHFFVKIIFRIAVTMYAAATRHQLTDDKVTGTDTKELPRPIVTTDITRSGAARPKEPTTESVFNPQVLVLVQGDNRQVQDLPQEDSLRQCAPLRGVSPPVFVQLLKCVE